MAGIDQSQKSGVGGFTLIELMVALVLGLLVIGMLVTVYLGNMRSSQFQNGLLRVQENGRFAIDMMSRTIRMAGYEDSAAVASPIKGTDTAADAALAQTNVQTGTDIIAVTFDGGAGIRDCQGDLIPLGSPRTSQYVVRNDFNLVCITNSGAGESELSEGVEDMQVLYGVDPSGDGIPNHYVEAANVGVGNWDSITSVEVTLLVNSVSNVLSSPDNVCIGCVVFPGSTDRRIRAEFQTIIDIRN